MDGLIIDRDIILKLAREFADHIHLIGTEDAAVARQFFTVIGTLEVADVYPAVAVGHPGDPDLQTTTIPFHANPLLLGRAQYLGGKLGVGPYENIPGFAIDRFSSFLDRNHFFR